MPRFHYTSMDESGQPASGDRVAQSTIALRALLESEGHRVESISLSDPGGVSPETASVVNLTKSELASLSESITSVTTAGLPLESGLRALSEEIPSRRMRSTLRAISDRLSRGEPLEQIVAGDIPGAPPALSEVIRAGLATGQPGIVLEAWSEHTRRANEVRRRILSGSIYSLVLMSMVLFVVFFLMFVIPEFEAIYKGFDIELPRLTAFIINLSTALRDDWLILLIGVFIFVGVIIGVCATTGRRSRHQLLAGIPLVGPIRRNLSLSTFCRLLAVLVDRQVPLPSALRAAGAGSRDGVIDAACRELAVDVEHGQSVEIAAGQRQLPPRLAHLFRWSNQPETFSKALRGSATMFEELASARARFVPTVLEPLVILGVGIFVSTCVVSLFMPLISLINNLS